MAIGLAKIVEKPIQDLSMDDIATEAGISRGLLFHYFPTKTDFYLACIAAAGRRMLRTTAPDESAPGPEQVETVTRLMIEQIERRRDFYLALVHGHGVADPRVSEVMDSVLPSRTERVMVALGVAERQRDVVRAWWPTQRTGRSPGRRCRPANARSRCRGWSRSASPRSTPCSGSRSRDGARHFVTRAFTAKRPLSSRGLPPHASTVSRSHL